jgi:hypothetical protein
MLKNAIARAGYFDKENLTGIFSRGSNFLANYLSGGGKSGQELATVNPSVVSSGSTV